ncbi:MAG: SBBP repeat-containing protein [Acidobacteria bacterium]|nr:SBBP repeat-containing protein [Acidobacteriota bacterium]
MSLQVPCKSKNSGTVAVRGKRLNGLAGCLILVALFHASAHAPRLDRYGMERLKKSEPRLSGSGPSDESPLAHARGSEFYYTFSDLRGTHPLPPAGKIARVPVLQAYGQLPLSFEANQGQTDSKVKFFSRSRGYSLFLTAGEMVLSLERAMAAKGSHKENAILTTEKAHDHRAVAPATVRMRLVGANADPHIVGLDELPGKSHYFIGNDPGKWRTNIPNYAKVEYQDVYPGVDLVFYGNQRQVEYDFVIAPGAGAEAIALDFQGADRLEMDTQGDLVLYTAGEQIRLRKPFAYQEVDGIKEKVAAGYVLEDEHRVRFDVASYDASRSLIIDPVLVYSTYLGGSGNDVARSIAVDASGNAYVTGDTTSADFPTLNPLQGTNGGGGDIFVAKLNPSGSALVYSTYLGGSLVEIARSIAVDASGNAYVTGDTSSANFPTVNPLQATKGGIFDAFVAKLGPSGSALVYSTYLGGSGGNFGWSITIDVSADAYITGFTDSTNFPIVNALQATKGGSSDAFVAKLNPSGSALVYSTYLGGSSVDQASGIGVDAFGNAYVTGGTNSPNFPTMNPLQATKGASSDVFVAKLNPSGSALVYSTYLGGSGSDFAFTTAVDIFGNAYITGVTSSTNFPVVNPLQQSNLGGSSEAFVAKLNAAGSALVYSTYLGGSGVDQASGIAVDVSGSAYITGFTDSTNFPIVNPLQATGGGGFFDAFVARLNPAGSALVYSTYLGGSGSDRGASIVVDGSSNAYLAGLTSSTNFPTGNALQPANGGSFDAFVMKIAGDPSMPEPTPIPTLSEWGVILLIAALLGSGICRLKKHSARGLSTRSAAGR